MSDWAIVAFVLLSVPAIAYFIHLFLESLRD